MLFTFTAVILERLLVMHISILAVAEPKFTSVSSEPLSSVTLLLSSSLVSSIKTVSQSFKCLQEIGSLPMLTSLPCLSTVMLSRSESSFTVSTLLTTVLEVVKFTTTLMLWTKRFIV